MRKLIAFTTLCFLSLLGKNEKAVCKSHCDVIMKSKIVHSTIINADADEHVPEPLIPFDGFFFKI